MSTPETVVLLPGILTPAAVRYAALLEALGPDVRGLPKELEVYAAEAPPEGYDVRTEVEGLAAFLDRQDVARAHLYGYSAGGSVALAFLAQHPDRVLSLALDEPATDFTAEDRASLAEAPGRLSELPPAERMVAFTRSLVRSGVQPPTLPPPPPGPESAKRPAGLLAWEDAMYRHHLDTTALRAFSGPVCFSHGSLSNERWEQMAPRMSAWFPRFRVDRYEGLHHLWPSHQADPARVAATLRELWAQPQPPASGAGPADAGAASARPA